MSFKRFLTVFTVIAFSAQTWGQDTVTKPPEKRSLKDHYAAVGSSVEIQCVADGQTKGVEWRVNGSVVASGPVLHLHNTSLDDGGIYTCHDSNGETIESLHLQLGYSPSSPVIHCWSPSYPLKALCSWSLMPDPVLPTHYISTYHLHQDAVVHSCQRQAEQDRQCVIEGWELYSTVPYLVNITAVNALGIATRILPVFFEEIVKPDPPVNIKVTPLPGRKLQVQWSPPPTWPDIGHFPLSYKVQFRWGKPSTASIVGPFESESMIRSGIVAGRSYQIRVSAMDFLGHGQSSDWSDPVSITPTNS